MRRRLLPAAAAVVVAAGLVSVGAAAPDAPSADLTAVSTDVSPAVAAYLQTGVLPTDVSGEPGVWNFVGPASECPGPGWQCVTLGGSPVVQTGTVNVASCVGVDCAGITQNGELNIVQCVVDPSSANQSCAGTTQTGPNNEFVCKLKTSAPAARQHCSWSQTGGQNKVLVEQIHQPLNAPSQCVVQTATGSQSGTTNELKVLQDADQQSSIGDPQRQEARQVVDAQQTATASTNTSDVQQYQDQVMSGAAALQHQNTGEGPIPTACAPLPPDCAEQLPPVKDVPEPTTCLDLEQTAPAGRTNLSSLHQKVQEVAKTTRLGTVDQPTEQQQGSGFGATPTGGNEGRVHQVILGTAGKSTSDVQQSTQQLLAAPGAPDVRDQRQYEDPDCCGISSQDGGHDNVETIDHHVDQKSDPGGFQVSFAGGSSRSSGSKCTINQSLTNNVDSASRSEEAEPCTFLIVVTACTSGPPPDEGDFEILQEEGEGCFEAPPVTSCPEGTEFVPGEGCVDDFIPCPEVCPASYVPASELRAVRA